MKFCIKDFFSKCDQIGKNLRISSHLQKKSLMENFIFWTVAFRFFFQINKVQLSYHFQSQIE